MYLYKLLYGCNLFLKEVIQLPRKGYTTIALPNILINEVEKIIKDKRHGFISKPEFIKEAIREKIRGMKN